MPIAITETELLTFLQAIERGEITLVPLCEPQDVYAGPVEYRASNGWTIAVFNDANEWDYIEYVRLPDGSECHYDDIFEGMPEVEHYEPSEEVAWNSYRIPGSGKFRCVRCGQFLKGRMIRLPFLCVNCAADAPS